MSIRSLRCNTCIYSQQSKCMQGEGSCVAKDDEACATIYYYKRNKHLYSTHMCKYKCKEEQGKKKDLMRVTMCCYKNLCNIA
ncbi:PREDICTED: prostate and testis expressed protein 4 [Chinchilla lanigera]|uniref:prostate and testis expressed protein 4 n=1 Tax=Chinchilla lanigera TaxID=34839 RepID=UPI000699033B|nr:PREDICTED: prostate and testis expressed protein 4 [Chinchilla lanigera]